jgi:hypothetical protein
MSKQPCEINQKTIDKIYENAKAAKEIYEKLDLAKKFSGCFHLRPTSGGITIVSTLSDAPMRGKDVSKEELKKTLSKINENFKRICGDDTEKALKILGDIGYKERKTAKSYLEENTQAEFIKGLLSKQPDYDGIEFVASELALERESRFDVVGFKNDTLYVFETKKGRTFSAMPQVAKYVKLVEENPDAFRKVLSVYPNRAVDSFTCVKGIAVMEDAANKTHKLREEAIKYDVGLWFYRSALCFEKK